VKRVRTHKKFAYRLSPAEGVPLIESRLHDTLTTHSVDSVTTTRHRFFFQLNIITANHVLPGFRCCLQPCRGSLERLGVAQIGLYQIHWPGFLTQAYSNDAFVQGLANCVRKGLTKSVGVSNFREERIRRAVSILEVLLWSLNSCSLKY
jgi:diketogulonate reductase-like aldo/keto reductase